MDGEDMEGEDYMDDDEDEEAMWLSHTEFLETVIESSNSSFE